MKKLIIIGVIFFIGAFTITAQILDVTFTTSDVKFSDEDKTSLTIPIRVSTSTGFVDEEITMNFDGYNQCRNKGKSKTVCERELKDDIQQNIETFNENKRREIKEQEMQDFKDEINIDNL